MDNLENYALITGGAKRIGREIAIKLAQNGYNIIIHYNSSEVEAQNTKNEIEAVGVNCFLVQQNLSDNATVKEFFSKIGDYQCKIRLLVNSASIFGNDTLWSVDDNSLVENSQINSYVPLFMSREFSKRVSKGHIINILDTKITTYDKEHFSYHISKKSLEVITKALALELAPNIQVNGIALGAILPPVGKDSDYLKERADALYCNRNEKDYLKCRSYPNLLETLIYLNVYVLVSLCKLSQFGKVEAFLKICSIFPSDI